MLAENKPKPMKKMPNSADYFWYIGGDAARLLLPIYAYNKVERDPASCSYLDHHCS